MDTSGGKLPSLLIQHLCRRHDDEVVDVLPGQIVGKWLQGYKARRHEVAQVSVVGSDAGIIAALGGKQRRLSLCTIATEDPSP
jgi:hypothetical protein